MATLFNLPPELIPHICDYLPRRSLALFSLTSSRLNALVTPCLYSHYRLSYSIPSDPDHPTQEERAKELKQRNVVRSSLCELAKSKARCGMIRTLEVWNYQRWIGEKEAEWLEQIVRQAAGVKEVRLLQDDDGAPFDPLLTPLAHFAPTWAALQTLPFLRRLRTSYGPNVILNLQSFPALEDVDMGMYYVDRAKDGVIPSGVKKLRLEYVCGFEGQQIEDETSWFKPNLFGSLTHLILVDMTTETCAYLERAVKLFASSCKTSTLTHLSLSLNRYPSLGQFSDVVGRTLHSLVSAFATLHSVQYLSIGSTPHPDEETLSDPVALLQTISDGYKNELKGLLLHVGEYGDEVVAAKSSGTFDKFRNVLADFKHLEQFQTNLIPLVPYPVAFPQPLSRSWTISPHDPSDLYYPLVAAQHPLSHWRDTVSASMHWAEQQYLEALPARVKEGGEGGLKRLVVGLLRESARKGLEAPWEVEEVGEVEKEEKVRALEEEGEEEEVPTEDECEG